MRKRSLGGRPLPILKLVVFNHMPNVEVKNSDRIKFSKRANFPKKNGDSFLKE